MPKGEIVGNLVFIDVKPRRSPKESYVNPRRIPEASLSTLEEVLEASISDGCI
jgi:hypothetical protein